MGLFCPFIYLSTHPSIQPFTTGLWNNLFPPSYEFCQVSTSVCDSWASVSLPHAEDWPSAPTLASRTVGSQWARARTWTRRLRRWCHQSGPWGCGAVEVWGNHLGGVPACPADPTPRWRWRTQSTRTSRTATTVGLTFFFFFTSFPVETPCSDQSFNGCRVRTLLQLYFPPSPLNPALWKVQFCSQKLKYILPPGSSAVRMNTI